MFKAVIFDFDYTLADSSKGVFLCINYALDKMNFKKVSIKKTNETIGLSLESTFGKLTDNRDSESAIQFKKFFIECADKEMAKNTFIYKSVPKTVKTLKEKGYILGIVSTKFRYRINDILSRYGIDSYFDLIIGGEDVGKTKPDPEGVNIFIKHFNLKAEECVLIGDSNVDAETAKNSGIFFIPVLSGTTKKEEFYKYGFKSYIKKFKNILDRL